MQFVSRVLRIDEPGGAVDVVVGVDVPVQTAENEWACTYRIGWPESPRTFQAFGIDPVQSVTCAFQMIAAELYTSPAHRQRKLAWTAPGEGYGFPMPANMRDIAEGEDKFL